VKQNPFSTYYKCLFLLLRLATLQNSRCLCVWMRACMHAFWDTVTLCCNVFKKPCSHTHFQNWFKVFIHFEVYAALVEVFLFSHWCYGCCSGFSLPHCSYLVWRQAKSWKNFYNTYWQDIHTVVNRVFNLFCDLISVLFNTWSSGPQLSTFRHNKMLLGEI